MPIFFKPGARIPVKLTSRADEPNTPTFFIRGLTGAEAMDFSDSFDSMRKVSSGREAIQKAFDAVRNALIGWEGLKDSSGNEVSYDPSKLEMHISLGEANELIGASIRGSSLSDDQRGRDGGSRA